MWPCVGSPLPQVCECVVILRNVKDVSWAGAKAMMADGNFLKSLLEFDKDSLTDKQVKRVKEYLRDKDFNYENLQVRGAGMAASERSHRHRTVFGRCLPEWRPTDTAA